jgi:hypothetical protein
MNIGPAVSFCSAQSGVFSAVCKRIATMASAIAAVGIAVAGTSRICDLLKALARLGDGRRGLAMVPKQTTGTKILPVAIAGEVLTALTDCAPDHGLRLKVVLLS